MVERHAHSVMSFEAFEACDKRNVEVVGSIPTTGIKVFKLFTLDITMGKITKIEMGDTVIFITLSVSPSEYQYITPNIEDIILFPPNKMDMSLTTGKIGNGNRIMVPNSLLKKEDIPILRKNVPSMVLTVEGKKYLIIELEDKTPGIPHFKDE